MKRTGEKVLSIISMITYTLSALLAVLIIQVVFNNEENVQKVIKAMKDENPTATTQELNLSIDIINTYVWMMVISIVAIVVGILALVLLTKYQRVKVAGTIF